MVHPHPLMDINSLDMGSPPMELLLHMDSNNLLAPLSSTLTMTTMMEPPANSVEPTQLTSLDVKSDVLQLLGDAACSILQVFSAACLAALTDART